MHKDEDLDCKVLSVVLRHFKKYLEIFVFWNLPLALLDSEKPSLLRVKKGSSSRILGSCGRWPSLLP